MTGQAGKVARGLRTIGANITQLAQGSKELEIQVNGTTQSIKLWNDAGTDMLNTYDVLQQISKYWDEMTNAEKSNLAITLAKKTQMDTFLATMSNFSDAEQAYVTALTSEGSAWKENAAYMESIEAHQASLKAAWKDLVLSQPFEDLEKALLDTLTAILNFLNSGVGQAIIKITALIAVVGLLSTALHALGVAFLATNIGTAVSMAIEAITVYHDLAMAIDLLTASMSINPLFLGATVAIAAITAICILVDKSVKSFEDLTQALEENVRAMKESESTIESEEKKLSDLEKAIDSLKDKKLNVVGDDETAIIDKQIRQLQQEEALTRSQLALEKEKLKTLQDEAKINADKLLNKQNQGFIETSYNAYNISATKSAYDEGSVASKSGSLDEALNQEINNMQRFEERIQSLNEKLEILRKNHKENSQTALDYAKEINDLTELMNEEEKTMNQHAEQLINASEAGYALSDSQQQVLDRYTDFSLKTDKATDSLSNFEDEESDGADEAQAISDAFEQAVKPLSDIENNYSLVAKAMKEFNEKGGMSASTIKKLAELDSKWLSVLQLKDGQLTIDKDLVDALAKSEQNQAIASLQAQAAQDMHNVALGNLDALSYIAKSAIEEITKATQDETTAATKAAAANFLEAESLKAKEEAAKGGNYKGNTQEAFEMINAIMSKYQGLIDNMTSWTLDFSDTSSSSAGKTKDAWVEAFEEEQRLLKHSLEMNEITELEYYEKLKDLNEKYFGEISGKHKQYLKEYQENEEEVYKGLKSIYEKVADYLKEAIEQGYEDAINALKKEEKRILEEIKAQIEALKDEKKKVLDEIQDQIDGLKKKKDKVQDYWDSQIDKIKEANSQLQKQNELLEKQQALQRAKAQKVMVMKGGKFQLGENESAVSQAQQALSEYQDQTSYEQQIEEMEKLRDKQVKTIDDRIEKLEEHKKYMEKYYDEQIDALEKYRDDVEKEYEKQIEALQEELDAFKRGAEEQKKIEEAKLAAQLLGIEKESDLFNISLSNLKNYVTMYNSLVAKLKAPNVFANGALPTLSGSGGSSSSPTSANGNNGTTITPYASGVPRIGSNEIALVGDAPNTELVVGSQINRSVGTLMNLPSGSGVVNAQSTSTLAGFLNGVVTPSNISNSRSTVQTFTFGNLTLPNVTDADSFVNTLSHKFNNYAIQYGNSRK